MRSTACRQMLCRIRLPRPFRSDVIRSHSDRVVSPSDSHPQDREEIKGLQADAVPKQVAETFQERYDKIIVSIESYISYP